MDVGEAVRVGALGEGRNVLGDLHLDHDVHGVELGLEEVDIRALVPVCQPKIRSA